MTVAPGPLLAGKIAVVTGAGSEVGRAISEAFAMHGATVVVADRLADSVTGTADAIAGGGGKVIPVVADVTRRADVERVRSLAGEVDTLVNTLGLPPAVSGDFLVSTEEEWEALFEVDLKRMLLCCHAMLPGMIERRKGGSVINVSRAGADDAPRGAVDSALRSGVAGFTRRLAGELDRHRIRVNAIAHDLRPWRRRGLEAPRVAGDVAGVALFLASDLAAPVSGTTVRVGSG
jgi:NAD(P)-dependent dehydrogenase (short-subunit alcohol dehydrogenase family)